MNEYKETFETWNKVASLYEEKFMDLELYNDTYDFICSSVIKNEATILEIGCGPGNIAKYLLSKQPDFNVFGIDIAPNMIELAKKNNPKANFEVMDSREISTIQQNFDAIVAGFCLPYLSSTDCEKLILDSNNLLNEGGFLYLSFVEGDLNKSGFKIGSSGDRTYFHYHNLDELKSHLLNNSFEDLKIFKLAYKKSEKEYETHTIVTAKKESN